MVPRITLDRQFALALTLPLTIIAVSCRAAAPGVRHFGPEREAAPVLAVESVSDSGLSVVLPRPGHLVVLELRPDAAPRLLYAAPPTDTQPLVAGSHTIAFVPGVVLHSQPARLARPVPPRGRPVVRGPVRECIVFNEGEMALNPTTGTIVSRERRVCGWRGGSHLGVSDTPPRPTGSRHLLLFTSDHRALGAAAEELARHVAGLPTGSGPEVAAQALADWLLGAYASSGNWAAAVYEFR